MTRNQFTKLSILLALLTALTACRGEDLETIPPEFTNPPKKEIVELSGKSFAEIMELKYDKAILSCELISRIGSEMGNTVSYLPLSQVSFDLKSEFQLPREIQLKARPTVTLVDGKQRVHETEATITIKAIDIVRMNFIDGKQKKTYKLDNSPRLTVSFFSNSKTSLDGVPESGTGTALSDRFMIEQLRENFLSEKLVSDPNYTATNQLDCTLNTEIKPDYQNDLIIYSH